MQVGPTPTLEISPNIHDTYLTLEWFHSPPRLLLTLINGGRCGENLASGSLHSFIALVTLPVCPFEKEPPLKDLSLFPGFLSLTLRSLEMELEPEYPMEALEAEYEAVEDMAGATSRGAQAQLRLLRLRQLQNAKRRQLLLRKQLLQGAP